MKRRGIAVLSAVIITAGSIFGVAYADDLNIGTQKNSQQLLESQKVIEPTQTEEADSNKTYSDGSCHSSKDTNKDMVKIMRENGFKDAAKYMQTGDYEKMNEFMNNMSEEDYQKMIDIMEQNGYGSMAQMMQSIGREGMIQMHNSMGNMHSGRYGMMGGFGPVVK
ncbi:MAG: hypothetical protein APF77_21615 [Clostridia bacterium BRH_c25]|nr:MAG: hypothetical protein APF77_21615 [Clostridia bacterium BRH_c25]